jgi:PAS domain S-box-containing protein
MNIFALISSLSALFAFSIGSFVLYRNHKNHLNRVFFFYCFTLAYYSFMEFGMRQADSFGEAVLWAKFNVLLPLVPALLIHFIMVFTEKTKWLKNKFTYLLVYSPGLIFFLLSITTELFNSPSQIAKEHGGWTWGTQKTMVFNLFMLWGLAIAFLSLFLCLRYYLKITGNKKRGAWYVLLGNLTFIGIGIGTDGLFSYLHIKMPGLTTLGFLVGGIFFAYAIWKYKLFAISLATAADSIVSTMTDALILVDPDGKIAMVNKATLKLLGYKESELVGKTADAILAQEPTAKKTWLERLKITGSVRDIEITFRAKDGKKIPVSFSGTVLRDEGDIAQGVVYVCRDLTERRKAEDEIRKLNEELEQRVKERTAELQKTYEQLRIAQEHSFQTKRMESIGMVTSGIAHDFNNLLAAILGNLTLAKMIKAPEKIAEALANAEKTSMRAKDLCQQLLSFAKGKTPEKKTVSVEKILKDSTDIVLPGSNVHCELVKPNDLWLVEADIVQIGQVINNLVINAVQAMPEGGTIEVRAENITVGLDDYLGFKPGRYVKVSIKDHGIGIPEENLPKIFDPLFTTKPKGTGLGLPTVYSIIKKHEGHIAVESKVGVGTTFHIYLPIAQEQVPVCVQRTGRSEEIKAKPETQIQANKKGLPVSASGGQTGKILVMDDEEDLRVTFEAMLVHHGYEVECSRDGVEAIERYKKAKESGKPFDVVILDLNIRGGMGGEETIKKLIEIDPNVKALLSSGTYDDLATIDFRKCGFSGFVPKPYTIEELSKILDEILIGKKQKVCLKV